MKNFKFSGQTFEYSNSSGNTIESGSVVVSGDYVGVAIADIADGESGPCQRTGVVDIPKVTGTAFTQGEEVYWDEADGEINDDNANPVAGHCHVAAASGDEVILVALVGGPAAFNGM